MPFSGLGIWQLVTPVTGVWLFATCAVTPVKDSAVASSSYLGNVLGWQLIISHPFCLDLSVFNMFSSSVQNNTQTSHKLEADDSREGSQSDQEALQQLAASVYPDLVQHLCAARDLEKAPKHKRLPRSCSTSTCCERFREVLKA